MTILRQVFCKKRSAMLLVLSVTVLLLFRPVIAQAVSIATEIKLKDGDGQTTISWKHPEVDKEIADYRVYQLRDGTEMAFGVTPSILVKDLKKDTSTTVKGLKNGEQYNFVLRAYDATGKELGNESFVSYPGTDPDEKPETPRNVYGSEGDNRVALFWDKSVERDLAGYEVFRRCTTDSSYRPYVRIPKIIRFESAQNREGVNSIISPGVFRDDKIKNGDICMYLVRAVNTKGKRSDFSPPIGLAPKQYLPPSPEAVLLLVNAYNSESKDVAQYYALKRGIPEENIVKIKVGTRFNYHNDLQIPLIKLLLKRNLAGSIKYIIPCYGIPVAAEGRALDSRLADLFDRYTWGRGMGTHNPFFNSGRHFDGTYGMYLVTRIDGPTAAIAKGLVDKALSAEKNVTAKSGRAMFVDDTYGKNLFKTGQKLGVHVVLKPASFSATELLPDDVFWYFGWRHMYKNIRASVWPDGAIAAHLISYSFMGGFKTLHAKDMNWVQGLLEDGITGTFGAVIEPYKSGYTREDLFFERFWSGDYTFGEAFMMATPTVQWAMSAVGDPLYRLK